MKNTIHLIIFTFLMLTSYQSLFSQSMAFTSGVGTTHYFDILKEEHLHSEYGVGKSYFLKIDFSNDQSNSLFSNFAFKIERQTGDIAYSSSALFCGLGVPSDLIFTNEQIEKYTISAISYPFIFPISKKIQIKTGFAINKSFNFNTSSNNLTDQNNDVIAFNSQIDVQTFSADATFEVQFCAYALGKNITMTPVYNAFIGVTKELEGAYNTHSIRQSLGLSFVWGLKKK